CLFRRIRAARWSAAPGTRTRAPPARTARCGPAYSALPRAARVFPADSGQTRADFVRVPSDRSQPRHAPHDVDDGLPDDPQVQGGRLLLDVLDVVLDPLLEVAARGAGPPGLPQARDPGADAQPRRAPGRAELVLGKGAGPGTDHRHVAP